MSGGYYYSDPAGQNGYSYDTNQYSPSYHHSDAASPASSSGYSDKMSGNGAAGDAYPCLVAGCPRSFARATDLERHYKTVHRSSDEPLIECPYAWCGRTGDRGFTRLDHYRDHLREVHQQDIPRSRKRPNFAKAANGS